MKLFKKIIILVLSVVLSVSILGALSACNDANSSQCVCTADTGVVPVPCACAVPPPAGSLTITNMRILGDSFAWNSAAARFRIYHVINCIRILSGVQQWADIPLESFVYGIDNIIIVPVNANAVAQNNLAQSISIATGYSNQYLRLFSLQQNQLNFTNSAQMAMVSYTVGSGSFAQTVPAGLTTVSSIDISQIPSSTTRIDVAPVNFSFNNATRTLTRTTGNTAQISVQNTVGNAISNVQDPAGSDFLIWNNTAHYTRIYKNNNYFSTSSSAMLFIGNIDQNINSLRLVPIDYLDQDRYLFDSISLTLYRNIGTPVDINVNHELLDTFHGAHNFRLEDGFLYWDSNFATVVYIVDDIHGRHLWGITSQMSIFEEWHAWQAIEIVARSFVFSAATLTIRIAEPIIINVQYINHYLWHSSVRVLNANFDGEYVFSWNSEGALGYFFYVSFDGINFYRNNETINSTLDFWGWEGVPMLHTVRIVPIAADFSSVINQLVIISGNAFHMSMP